MIAPVRMVCGACLRSLELVPDEAGRLPALCPVCNGTIDSRLSEIETPTREYVVPAAGVYCEVDGWAGTHCSSDCNCPPVGGGHWQQTWTNGSLGQVDRFFLRELRGDGGFGRVYKAWDPRLDRDVALKVLKQSDPSERIMQRFFREARSAAQLKHPNLVEVYDSGCDEGRCWIAYEYVEGSTLARVMDTPSRPGLIAAVRIARDLADAVDYAHRHGVYHRDLKPANVIIDREGRPRLTDFGLARIADQDSDLTRDGAVLGTPAYMSPEQASGRSHQADERSDIYSLGVMLYELLSGRRPFDTPSGVTAWQVPPAGSPPPIRSFNKTVPAELERICLKALALDRNDRYDTARDLRSALDGWLRDKECAPVISIKNTHVVIGIVALLLIVGLGYALHGMIDAFTVPVATRMTRPGDAPVVSPRPAHGAPTEADPTSEVYHLPGSHVYHLKDGCPSIKGREDAEPLSLADAVGRLHLSPCGHCYRKTKDSTAP